MRKTTALFYGTIAAMIILMFAAAESKASNWILLISGAVFFAAVFAAYNISEKTQFSVPSPKRTFAIILAVGVLMRLVLGISIYGYETDINCFLGWSQAAYGGGLDHFYTSGMFADYPPLYMYVLYFLGALQSVFHIGAGYFLVKIPAILCDAAIALFVYDIACNTMQKNERNLPRNGGDAIPLFMFACIILNPALIMNSAVWGQIDIIYTFMTCACIYMLLKKKYTAVIILFALSLLLKVQTILIGPVLLFVFVRGLTRKETRKRTLIQLIAGIGISAGVCLLLILPFTDGRPLSWIIDLYLKSLGGYPYVSINGFNLFGLFGLNWAPLNTQFLGLPFNAWGMIGIAGVCIYALWLYIKAPHEKYLFNLMAFIVLGVYIFSHSMHERYFFAVPVLLLLSYCYLRDKRIFYASLLVSASMAVGQCIALEYYAQWIPYPIMAAVSALSIFSFAYSAVVITKNALEYNKKIIKKGLVAYEN